MYYDDVETGIIEMLQGDIPIESNPYRNLAIRLNVSEEALVERIAKMKADGLIRRLGAVLRHRESGFLFNALVVFRTMPGSEDQAGAILAECSQITHCYLREVPDDFGYNLFAMMHCKQEGDLAPLLEELLEKTGLDDYLIIRSVKEYKKISMQYIDGPVTTASQDRG